MSFDIKIVSGDIALGTSGDLQKVENIDKLLQDSLKIVLSDKSNNKYHSEYGSDLNALLIGTPISDNWVSFNKVRQSIVNALQILAGYQLQQTKWQITSLSELIFDIEGTYIEVNKYDPRHFDVTIFLVTQDLQIAKFVLPVTL